MIRIRIGHDENTASWLTFPEQPWKLGMRYAEIAEEAPEATPMVIYEAESSIATLPAVLKGMETDEKSVMVLERLVERLKYLTAAEQELFAVALQFESPQSAKDILNLSYNLDNYELTNGSDQEGKTVLKREGRSFQEVYEGNFLPDAGYDKNAVFLLHLYTGQKCYSLAVPTTPEKMEMAKANLEVKNLNQCHFNQYGGPFNELWEYIPVCSQLKEVNRIAAVLKKKVAEGNQYTVPFLKAVFLAECPRTIKEAIAVLQNLEHYEFLESVQDPELYAREAIKTYGDPSLEPLLDRFVNWKDMGQAMMSDRGAVQTEHGIVTCKEWCCERLPNETVVTCLYSLMKGDLCDSEGCQESMDAHQLVGYEAEIQMELEKDFIFEQKKGLAEYLDNQLMKERILSMFPAVEVYHNALWSVLKVETKGELTPNEMEWVKEYWRGQASDGWGEGFEQTDIECEEENVLNVHFYNSSMLYGIRTEQELKGGEALQQDPVMGGIS